MKKHSFLYRNLVVILFGVINIVSSSANYAYGSIDSQGLESNFTNLIDSLETELHKTKHDTDKILVLNQLAVKLRSNIPDLALEYAHRQLELSNNIIFNAVEESVLWHAGNNVLSKAYNNIGTIYDIQGNYNEALANYFKSLAITETIGNLEGSVHAYNNIGILYWNQGNYKKALEQFFKSLKIRKRLGDQEGMGDSYNNIGVIYWNQGNYDKAIEQFFKSLKIREKLGDQKGLADSYNNIGLIYSDLGNYGKALEQYDNSLEIREKLEDKKGLAGSYINIGIVYKNQKRYENALRQFFKSLKIRESIGDKEGIAMAFVNIGKIYKALASDSVYVRKEGLDTLKKSNIGIIENEYGSMSTTKKEFFTESLKYFLKAIYINEEIGSKAGIVENNLSIGDLYLKMGKNNESLPFLEQAALLAEEIGAKPELRNAYKYLSIAYEKAGEYEKALKCHNRYSDIKDSIFNKTSAENLNELQTKYETEKKEKEIELLNTENEVKELEVGKQKGLRNFSIFGLGLVILIAFLFYNRFKIKQKANILLQSQNNQINSQKSELEIVNKELGKKNKSISESINYAQRIQESIMPTANHLHELFPDSFMFYKAKDVVSGDFPFIIKNGENIFVAAVDCTGHGVPGAMMSMIGNFLLNDIISENSQLLPGEVLNRLHTGVLKTLKQEENLESQDGMDIALCKINSSKKTIDFAGAHRPLFFMSNGVIQELKGNRFPIGGTQYSRRGKEINFVNHQLNFKQEDSIYIFSDGLTDQIGGSAKRKFGTKQIQEIIVTNNNKTMKDIGNMFNKSFNDWQGKGNQLDDVLMIGIRV